MISTLFTVAISLASLSYGSAIPARREPGILRLPITAAKGAMKRQVVSPLENIQTGTRYMVEFSIGTPPQNLALSLDTGSSETWVNPQCSAAGPQANIDLCNSFPTYNPNVSSTALDFQQTTTLSYGKGTAHIDYFSDHFNLGGAVVTGQQFGVATSSSDLPVGLMGVGPGIELTGYPIIIDTLAKQGVTNSRAFSLDLRSYESPDGAIIFGGIDTAKYSGSLEKCPIIPAAQAPDSYPRYWIHMKSVGITKPGEVSSKLYAPSSSDPLGQPVFLDSGGTLTRLPAAVVKAIIADFPGATEDGNSGLYLVDCSVGDQAGTVDFGFGNTVINVPFSEFIWHIEGICYLGVAVDDVTPVLGDTFLRAAFVVYDQDNQNLHLANAKNCGTNLVAIGSGPDAVPSIVGACGPSSTSSSSSSSATSSSTISSSASITSSSASITSSSVSGFPTISSNSTGLYPMSNHTSTAGPTAYPTAYTTSTVYSTSKYTITSCAASVTNCPTGKVTQTVVQYTTVCPVSHAPTITSKPSYNFHTTEKTKTVYATKTYTISKCGPEVKNCPYGSTTTTVTPVSTSVHYISYAVTTVAGYTVAPYELVAHPVPVAPVVPIQYPVPVKPVPTGVKPGSYNPATKPVSVPTAAYTPVGSLAPYPTVAPPASYVPTPAAASDFHTFSSVPSGALLPTATGFVVSGAVSSVKVGNAWALAAIALGLLFVV
ncbi:aspartic peptidase domain-containing protein [Rhexocercosporidium sp. MPI-PUGE-AT-0058]|nr:aspartic peptidase domain-containing protein [Rhexocercosporidium sp. MPI-PUGE-AT-0058]